LSAGPDTSLALIGCGSVFNAVRAVWPRLGDSAALDGTERALHVMALTTTDTIAIDVPAYLAGLDPSKVRIFAAVDYNALNHARLDVYACTRLRGFKCVTLVHPDAMVEADARLGENCWIGAGAIISAGVRIGNNTFIAAGARIDAGAQIGANVWIGPGAAVGNNARIGTHCVVGADVKIAANVVLGRHCVIDVPGAYAESLPDGSFIDPLFAFPVHIFGGSTRSAG